MLTTVWGPSMWHYLHTMSFNYPIKPTKKKKKHKKKKKKKKTISINIKGEL